MGQEKKSQERVEPVMTALSFRLCSLLGGLFVLKRFCSDFVIKA
jgi:hypothetical protein